MGERGPALGDDERDDGRAVLVHRWEHGVLEQVLDRVAHEEPLEIQLGGVAIAVVMRTPGHDAELVLGFLLTERVIDRPEQVVSIRESSLAAEREAEGNVVNVVLVEGLRPPFERLRRNTYASSSCGVCGKATIRAALLELAPVSRRFTVAPASLGQMARALRQAQPEFELTGGLHAAGLFSPSGELVFVREDVGRHNAVDKVLGAAAGGGLLDRAAVLFVSGRVSVEVVQKAAACGIAVVAAVSAPTSLAVRFAEELGITLVGFVREGRFNVYSRIFRVASA